MVKAVVFDAFGTLVRSVGAHGPYFKLSKLIPCNSYLLKRHELMTTDRSFEDFLKEADSSVGLLELQKELEAEIGAISLFDDVSAYIDVLRWKGYKVAVCSNLAHAYGAPLKALLPDVDAMFLSYETGLIKPDPRIFHHVARHLDVGMSECLFVGDSPRSDVNGASAAGMHSHLLRRSRGAPPIQQQVDPVLERLWS